MDPRNERLPNDLLGSSPTIHGMDRFERHDLRHMTRNLLQYFFQVLDIVVPKDMLRNLTVSNTLDHRRVVTTVRENMAVRQAFG
jgi:hypothetical protein